jgi:hypothetical protein
MSKTIAKAFAGGVVIAGIKKLIDSASELSETISKSQTIFGENAAAVEQWSNGLASNFGIAKAAALEAASSFASMFQILGVGDKEAVTMSKTLVELAADMASFNNTSIEDALLAIGSGLRGEAEPLRKFNVLLNDASLRAESLAMGLTDGKSTLDLQTKALASYSIIMKQTAVAQGDFAKTSDGLANSMRIIKAESENASAKVGGKLLPVVEKITSVFKGAASTLADWALGGIANFNAVVASATQAVIEIGSAISAMGKAISQAGHLEFSKATKTLESIAERNEESGERIAQAWREARAEAFAGADAPIPGGDKNKAGPDNGPPDNKSEQVALENKIASARERLAKASFDALQDETKLNELLEERDKLLGEFDIFDKKGSKEELRNIEIQTRLAQISKESDALRKKIAGRGEKPTTGETVSDEPDISQSRIMSSMLASIGGGGNVAAFTTDPQLFEAKEANKILRKIERNTTPAAGVPLTPEL